MIRPPGFRGAAFTTAAQGDMKDPDNRLRVADGLGIPSDWASVRQIHGDQVQVVTQSGAAGPGDALVTATGGLPLAVNVADCAGLVIETAAAVAVALAAARHLEQLGGGTDPILRVAIGPMIGPCCFEVGPEVAELFHDRHVKSTNGLITVDLESALQDQIPSVRWWSARACTRCEEGWFSYRSDQTHRRTAAIGWIP